ncbi:MAG: helix-turn-helix transcriptional regulator [Synergistaceae bacterium]|nr:helix-turn-helix transcriptional regulator [Synergistaceae bacterium]
MTWADLDAIRIREALSVPELARRAGCDHTTLYRAFSGKSSGSADVWRACCAARRRPPELAQTLHPRVDAGPEGELDGRGMSGDEVWWTLERSGDMEMREMVFEGAREAVMFAWRMAMTLLAFAFPTMLAMIAVGLVVLMWGALKQLWRDMT